MPYNKRKQKCKQSDGTPGSYVLSYTDKKGKKRRACHTSKKKMQGQIAAIEAESKVIKITRDQLNQLIKEALEIHLAPEEVYDYIDTFPEEYSNLDRTNITKDEAFSAGCAVCGSQARDDCDQKVVDNISTNLQRTFEKEAQAKSAALSSASTLAKSLEESGTSIDDWLLGRIYVALLRMSRLLQGRTITGKYKEALGAFQISEGKMKITRKQLIQIVKEELAKLPPYKNYQYGVDQMSKTTKGQEDIIGHT